MKFLLIKVFIVLTVFSQLGLATDYIVGGKKATVDEYITGHMTFNVGEKIRMAVLLKEIEKNNFDPCQNDTVMNQRSHMVAQMAEGLIKLVEEDSGLVGLRAKTISLLANCTE